jgi:ABC-2 type transport system permease protein
MTALLRAELIKLRTTRTFLALTAAAIGTSLLITVLVSVLTEPTEDSVLTDVFTADTSALFIIVLAVVGITGEWRHHTITSSLLAAPDRLRFLAAKVIAFGTAGLLLSLLISIAIAVVGLVILNIRDLPVPEAGELLKQIVRNALVAALLGAFGVGIGALVRNQVVAVVSLLIVAFAIDPAVAALAPEVGRFSPFGGLPAGITDVPPEDAGLPEEMDILSPGLAVLAMLAWIGSAFAVGAALLIQRDLD